jgi:DNA-binding beta-propeller fold protein YncE
MLVGQDGKLYCTGSISADGSASNQRLFRLDGSQFTIVATPPHGGYGLAQDNQGIIYTVITTGFPSLHTHEVWTIDPTTGATTLLADGPNGALCIAYDRVRNRLYVADENGNIFYLAKSTTPVFQESWGTLKVRYH